MLRLRSLAQRGAARTSSRSLHSAPSAARGALRITGHRQSAATVNSIPTIHARHLSAPAMQSRTSLSQSSSPSSYTPLDLPVGSTHHHFTVQSATPIEDFNLTVYHLRHPSGAEYYHIDRDDDDNTFAITFRTPPNDSTGVAHILEHTVLCGSQSFPVRDPFFTLHRRSLKTYMNAMTAQDFTMYPFSSQNSKDFDNLLAVYLDAVFRPLLRELDFRQEGHRLELDDSASLTYKGVVFNEMKGAMSDTGQLFAQRLQSLIFKDTQNLYHHNSGGEPGDIPNLTHTQLKEFHAKYYSPNNACFFSYGHVRPPFRQCDEILSRVKQERVNGINNIGSASSDVVNYHPQPAATEPVTETQTCPPDPLTADETKQTKLATSFVLNDLSAIPSQRELINELFSLSLLSSLLLDGPMSPFYQSLIESGLGHSYAPGTGFDGDIRQPTFTIGVSGCHNDDIPTISRIIDDTLAEYSERGFELERVEAILHQLEISVKHVSTQFGIALMMRMMTQWAHDLDPTLTLHINEKIAAIRQSLADNPGYFQALIKKHLLNNKHRVTLIMTPDEEYAAKENEIEQSKLKSMDEKMQDSDKERIRTQASLLKEEQEKKNDPSILPTLTVSDIKKEAERVTLTALPSIVAQPQSQSQAVPVSPLNAVTHIETPLSDTINATSHTYPVPVYTLEAATNGCAYVRILYNMQSLPAELRPFLSLFTAFFTEMGAAQYDYRQLSHVIDLHTGGISASMRVFNDRHDNQQHQQLLLLRGMSLERNIHHLLLLTQSLLYEPHFNDLQRLKQLIIQSAAAVASSMQDSGHGYAKSVASSTLNPASFINEQLGGIAHVTLLNELAANINNANGEELLTMISEKLQAISQYLQRQGPIRSLIVGDGQSLTTLEKQLPSFMDSITQQSSLSHLNSRSWSLPDFTPASEPTKIFYALPISVNNASLVIPTVPYAHPDSSPLTVGAKLLSSVFVHREVREKGGAYGGGAGHGDGMFSFYSFRDPNHSLTLNAFERGIEWLASPSQSFTSSDVEEALLSLFSNIDAPTPPSSKGLAEFVTGMTWEERQQHREQLLAVKGSDLIRVAEQYLIEPVKSRAQICVVGDETRFPTAEASERQWTIKRLELAQPASEEADEGANGDWQPSTRAGLHVVQ